MTCQGGVEAAATTATRTRDAGSPERLTDAEPDERNRAMQAVPGMRTIDLAAVEQAFGAG